MKKIFTNDGFFLTVTLLASICGVLYSVLKIMTDQFDAAFAVPNAASAICALIIYISYAEYNKNLMKGMMGALLMGRVVEAAMFLGETSYAVEKIFAPIYLAIVAVVFVNHFIINSDRYASPVNVKINQIAVAAMTVLAVVWSVAYIPYLLSADAIEIIEMVLAILSYPAMCLSIVCVESRLDAYRQDREAAGWTEEKGYPEGYVHEHDKHKM